MSKLNKIITNQPVVLTEEEVNNLSETLSAVRTAGGGEGGHLYTGDNKYIGVDNGNYKIKFLDNAAEKLESISNKLDKTEAANTYLTSADAQTLYQTKEAMSDYAKKTEIPDSISAFDDTESVIYSYINPATAAIQQQLNGKQNKLQFDLNAKGEISAIGPLYGTTTALVGANGITGDYYSASNPSGFINSAQAETQILAKNYITSGVSELDNFYSKTDTSSKTELQTKFNSLLDYDVVTGNSAVLITTADANNTRTFTISLTATPTAADTVLNGQNGVDATLNGNVWNVGLSQSAYNAVNNVQNKLDTTVADQTYQPKGNYVSSTDITDMATKTWVNDQGYIKQETDWTNTIQEASAKAYNDATANANSLYQAKGDYVKNTDISLDANNKITAISGKELIITAHQSLTDYYTKSQTSGAIELSTEFGKYALKSEIPTVPTKVSDLTDSANYYKTTETSGATEISTALDKKVDKPDTTQVELNNKYLIYSTLSAEGQPKGWVDMQTKVYSKTEADGTFQKKTDMGGYLTTEQYATDSATFYPTSNPDGYLTKTNADTYYQPTGYYATSAGLTAGNQYAMTTTGWEVVQGGTSFTGVVTGVGLSGNGLSNSPLGIDTTVAIYFTNASAKSALSADKAASASAAKRLQDSTSGPVIQVGDVTALQNWASSNSSTWDNVSAKSTVSANTATNVISVSANSTATTANISATTYYTNTADSNLVAQRLFVVHNDDDLVAHVQAGLCQGQGSLFFVMSGFNS